MYGIALAALGMLATLAPLHAQMERQGPETLKEIAFVQAYGRELHEAKERLASLLPLLDESNALVLRFSKGAVNQLKSKINADESQILEKVYSEWLHVLEDSRIQRELAAEQELVEASVLASPKDARVAQGSAMFDPCLASLPSGECPFEADRPIQLGPGRSLRCFALSEVMQGDASQGTDYRIASGGSTACRRT